MERMAHPQDGRASATPAGFASNKEKTGQQLLLRRPNGTVLFARRMLNAQPLEVPSWITLLIFKVSIQ
jgi:hypothetical protein